MQNEIINIDDINSGGISRQAKIEQITFPSAHSSGFTKVGYIATLDATSVKVFGISSESAIANLRTLLESEGIKL